MRARVLHKGGLTLCADRSPNLVRHLVRTLCALVRDLVRDPPPAQGFSNLVRDAALAQGIETLCRTQGRAQGPAQGT